MPEHTFTGGDAALGAAVFERLRSGRPLDDLPLGRHEGRVDLRKVRPPAGESLWLRDVTLDGLDFSGASLPELRFMGATVTNCRFDGARCRDARVWTSTFRDTTFRSARLRDAVLGSWHEEREPVYRNVDFSGADLRGIGSIAASYEHVDFSGARIEKTDFQASSFSHCVFAGPLREVIFWERYPTAAKPAPNLMDDVDFSRAELHWVEFRGLSLDAVRLPDGSGHTVVHHYPCVLRRALERLAGTDRDRPFAPVLAGLLAQELHWANPDREVGIWHHDDLGETPAERAQVAAFLRDVEAECG